MRPRAQPTDFQDPAKRDALFKMMQGLTAETNVADAKTFIDWLDKQAAVDKKKKIGTTGYCMGGPLVMRTAATVPNRVGGAATFHGGGLVTDKPDSPHLLIPKMKAQFLIAIAGNDDQKEPNSKTVLKKAFDDNHLKIVKPKSSLPMSCWRSTLLTLRRSPALWSAIVISASAERELVAEPANT